MSPPQIRKGKVRLLLDQGNGVQVQDDDHLHVHGVDGDLDLDEHRTDDDLRLSESWGTWCTEMASSIFGLKLPNIQILPRELVFFSSNVFQVSRIAHCPTIKTFHEMWRKIVLDKNFKNA